MSPLAAPIRSLGLPPTKLKKPPLPTDKDICIRPKPLTLPISQELAIARTSTTSRVRGTHQDVTGDVLVGWPMRSQLAPRGSTPEARSTLSLPPTGGASISPFSPSHHLNSAVAVIIACASRNRLPIIGRKQPTEYFTMINRRYLCLLCALVALFFIATTYHWGGERITRLARPPAPVLPPGPQTVASKTHDYVVQDGTRCTMI